MPAVDLAENTGKEAGFHGPAVRRFSAEQFRDAVAQVTGVWYDKADFGGTTNHVRASFVATDPLMTALGRPSREQVVTVRATTATTLQGLELTNGKTLARILQRGAERLAANFDLPDVKAPAKMSTDLLLDRIYLQALGRKPKSDERKLARELVGDPVRPEGVEDLLWAVCMLPKFQLIY